MTLKRHHKVIIGGISSALIMFILVSSILTYVLFARMELNYNKLSDQITGLQTDTQVKLNDLTENAMKTKEELGTLGIQLGSMDEEFSLLKASASADFSGIIEDAVKSVVTIRTDVGQGTGFIITKDGFIVTNAHILSGGSRINAITYDQKVIDAQLVGYDALFDIAILKIEGDYNVLTFANSEDIQIGEKVIAIGNPLGLQFSVSEGIVSAVHREGISELNSYIQTDAALNPGNSGGPLINKNGEVIGINNFKINTGESLGFALESNYIIESVNKIGQNSINKTLI